MNGPITLSGLGRKPLINQVSKHLARQADIAFVFSGHMQQKRTGLNDELHVVLPAGDVPHYAQAREAALAAPADLATLPRAGYRGDLCRRPVSF